MGSFFCALLLIKMVFCLFVCSDCILDFHAFVRDLNSTECIQHEKLCEISIVHRLLQYLIQRTIFLFSVNFDLRYLIEHDASPL